MQQAGRGKAPPACPRQVCLVAAPRIRMKPKVAQSQSESLLQAVAEPRAGGSSSPFSSTCAPGAAAAAEKFPFSRVLAPWARPCGPGARLPPPTSAAALCGPRAPGAGDTLVLASPYYIRLLIPSLSGSLRFLCEGSDEVDLERLRFATIFQCRLSRQSARPKPLEGSSASPGRVI